jgi:hypothetical protein
MSKTIFIVLQDGGSSVEAYATTYDTSHDAHWAMRAHSAASYDSAGPFEVPVHEINGKTYIEEADVLELIQRTKVTEYESW